ncbi:MAG: phosphatidylglycerophosphatase A [Rhodobacteraceae bacterium]|nr:phosphatidylglycerophosphatase A [Paracoccaceae bacterium]
MSRFFATFFHVGLLPWAPGTWGSAAAIPAAWIIHLAGGFPALLAAAVLVSLGGWWATAEATRGKDDHDPGEIVIDEVAGVFIALLPVSLGAGHAGVGFWQLYPGIIAAFVLFRVFDIRKPGPIGWADRRNDALGVMLDDIIAGIFAAIGVGVLAWLSHGVFGF